VLVFFFFHTVQISGAIWTGARPPRGTLENKTVKCRNY